LNIGPDYNIFPNIIPILSKFQLQRYIIGKKKYYFSKNFIFLIILIIFRLFFHHLLIEYVNLFGCVQAFYGIITNTLCKAFDVQRKL